MKGKLCKGKDYYRSRNGNDVFRYEVSGTEKELAAYKEAQGEFYREDESTGKPIFFSSTFGGNTVDLLISSKGKVFIDNTEFRKAASLIKAAGGDFGQVMGTSIANKLVDNMFGSLFSDSTTSTQTANQAPVEQVEAEEVEEVVVDEETGEIISDL